MPCQDTPAVKHTYYAQVKQTPPNMVLLGFLSRRTCDCDVLSTQLSVPKDLVAVMSAVHDGHEMDRSSGQRAHYLPLQTAGKSLVQFNYSNYLSDLTFGLLYRCPCLHTL